MLFETFLECRFFQRIILNVFSKKLFDLFDLFLNFPEVYIMKIILSTLLKKILLKSFGYLIFFSWVQY